MELTRRNLALMGGAASLALALRPEDADAAVTFTPLGVPATYAQIPFGCNSYYLQPWRNMITTRSLASYSAGMGIQNADMSAPQSLAMLAGCGLTQLRIGLNWGAFSYTNPTQLTASVSAQFVPYVKAAQKAGMRPLIMLQAFDQAPCPYSSSFLTLAAPLGAGDTTMTLSDTSGLVAGLSGLTASVVDGGLVYIDATNQKMCDVFFTAINGNVVTLSQPTGTALPQGTMVLVNTLMVKPWSQAGSTDYKATMAGWLGYMDAVSTLMQSILGTAGAADLGFDLEIWNELTFGSDFLDINNYYAIPVYTEVAADFPATAVDIVAQTASHATAYPALYAGVRIADGFSSCNPTPASSTEPARVSAMTKHFYPSINGFPASNYCVQTLDVNANPTSFVPSFTAYNHEIASNALAVYGIGRDVTTETNYVGTTARGMNARTVNGQVAPVTIWMTESGTATELVGVTSPSAITMLQTKGFLRSMFFNLGIGVERVYAFQAVGDTTQFALVPSSAPTTATLPLTSLRNAMSFIRGNTATGVAAGALAQYSFSVAIGYGSPETLWTGDGTNSNPTHLQPQDFVILPIQVSPTRVAFAFWFICNDMRQTMSRVYVGVTIKGYTGTNPTLTAYDPVYNVALPSGIASNSNGTAVIALGGACDYPCIAVLQC